MFGILHTSCPFIYIHQVKSTITRIYCMYVSTFGTWIVRNLEQDAPAFGEKLIIYIVLRNVVL